MDRDEKHVISQARHQAPARGVSVECDVASQMRDGVTLRANVYRPDGEGPWPTLLMRTPYDKNDLRQQVWCGVDPVQVAREGFIVVIQDVRGRFASDGEWDSLRFERQDGYDTVEWAAKLQGSSGRVAMFGGSYCGATQWLAARDAPQALAAISPAMTWSEPLDGLFGRGGAVELGLALRWALENGFDTIGRRAADAADRRRRVAAAMGDWDRLNEVGYWELPVSAAHLLRRHQLPDLGAIRMLQDAAVAGWCRVAGAHDQVQVPSFHTAGWYDIFLQGTLDNHMGMVKAGHEARLVVGPWTHLGFADPIGELLFGMSAYRDDVATDGGSGWRDLQLSWLRAQLGGEPAIELPESPVSIFVMGVNRWRHESRWPPPATVKQRWFLSSDGELAITSPGADEPCSEFVYDPADPVPTAGGHGVMAPGVPMGPTDQAEVESHGDVLVFTSEPLRADLEVTGAVRAVLHACSSAPSTDWVVRLCDVHPDGRSINICDGIVRVGERANVLGPHEIDLWSTSNVFLRGHRLRLHVTSSSFPRWDRNLNTGDQANSRCQIARQRIHHDADRPSFIELSVLPAHTR